MNLQEAVAHYRIKPRWVSRIRVYPSGCWVMCGWGSKDGYANYNRTTGHRVVYEALVGPIPTGLQLDHLCHTRDPNCPSDSTCLHRRCVRPDHLDPVTVRENALRSNSPLAKKARQTHCKWGHEFTPENTYRWRTNRICRACRRTQPRRSRATTRKAEL